MKSGLIGFLLISLIGLTLAGFGYTQTDWDVRRSYDLAGATPLDVEQFKKDMRDPRISAKVQQDMAEGTVAGVRKPPAVFVNGRLVRNTTPEDIEASIEKELKRLGG